MAVLWISDNLHLSEATRAVHVRVLYNVTINLRGRCCVATVAVSASWPSSSAFSSLAKNIGQVVVQSGCVEVDDRRAFDLPPERSPRRCCLVEQLA